jgi:6-phosphogluconolactonase
MFALGASMAQAKTFRAYIGTYSTHGSEGVYVCDFDPASGDLSAKRVAAPYTTTDGADFKNASFLAFHPTANRLYAVSEIGDFRGTNGGGVVGFTIDAATGALARINDARTGGGAPCHLAIDPTGRGLVAANYGGGSVAVVPMDAITGELKAGVQVIQHTGSGVDPVRQEAAHPHEAVFDPTGRLVFVPDLGLDKVFVYRFDAEQAKLVPHDPPFVAVTPGAGPRHLAFHPNGKLAYVVNELNSTVTAFSYDPAKGTFRERQTISTLPKDVNGENTCAEIVVHPSGKTLYASNRGRDSIAMFSVDPVSGKLTPRGHQPTGGRTPRHFTIDPTGNYLLAANQDSDSITVHRIDQATGGLKETGHKLDVPSPVCVLFAPMK